MANKPNDQELRQQNVAEAVSKTELFFQKYSKIIYGCVAAILLIALAILAYNRFILQPQKEKAQAAMYQAEQKFTAGNYALALAGDDNMMGFEEIIDTYGSKAGQAVYLYAGACALQTGDFDKAIKFFKKYAGEDSILLSRAQAGIGDAYVGLEDYKNALAAYEKAAATVDNVFSAGYLLKAGQVAEELGDKDKALAFYNKIKDQYPNAVEAADIDKFITRIEF
ncbi:MAG: tetratricopeptide repeat protein [Bacteroidales bacterium]|jgi:tetratricopeptide (TPR) repeat protein|nr:tetratricopeptide repeat protein [Bacteroidales bacterium]MBR6863679.1 tetratricopeptide repeat protein [Bacteroidales bacterium]